MDGLIEQARAAGLARTPDWLSLGHYQRNVVGRLRSLVDDPQFFLSPAGKYDPEAELAATLQAFFAPVSGPPAEHPICRFVARFQWLNERLHFDPARLPMADCAEYRRIYDYVRPAAVTLVFPSAYMNGPASMFGHTLVVFDATNQNRLLSRAVSYAARTAETVGPLFAFAGIFGLYPGYYAYQPYYEKVQQYGDMGHRDVWEYELSFAQPEIDRMMAHAWELQNIYSRYFFFDENCAYNLYFLFDVARPSLQLARDAYEWFVMPINTVRALDQRGLVSKVLYRPCPVTRMKHLVRELPEPEKTQAYRIAKGQVEPVAITDDPAARAGMDLAAEYTKYLYTEKLLAKEVYTRRLVDVLKVRSRMGPAPADEFPVPIPPRPDQGHRPRRLSLSGGAERGDAFAAIRYRVAYHALEDHDDGFTVGSQIQFLNTELRYSGAGAGARLQRFDIVDVFSLSPRDRFFRPGSWKFRGGVEQSGFEEEDLVWQFNTGGGHAYAWGRRSLLYFMVEADGQLGDYYHADYGLGLGPSIGALTYTADDWKHLVQVRTSYIGLGDDLWRTSAEWRQAYRLRADLNLELGLAYRDYDGRDSTEASWSVHVFF